MSKINIVMALVLAVLFGCDYAFAIGNVTGKITQIRVDADGRAMIFFDKPIQGSVPSCVHPAYTSVLAVDASTDGGKAVLSMALTAKTSDRLVTAYGLGQCSVYGPSNAEDWNYGIIK